MSQEELQPVPDSEIKIQRLGQQNSEADLEEAGRILNSTPLLTADAHARKVVEDGGQVTVGGKTFSVPVLEFLQLRLKILEQTVGKNLDPWLVAAAMVVHSERPEDESLKERILN